MHFPNLWYVNFLLSFNLVSLFSSKSRVFKKHKPPYLSVLFNQTVYIININVFLLILKIYKLNIRKTINIVVRLNCIELEEIFILKIGFIFSPEFYHSFFIENIFQQILFFFDYVFLLLILLCCYSLTFKFFLYKLQIFYSRFLRFENLISTIWKWR